MNKALMLFLTGVAIGVLFAPDKGSATRKKLEEGYDDMVDKFHEKMDKWKNIAERAKEKMRHKGETPVSDVGVS